MTWQQVPFFADDASLHDFAAELAMNATTVWYRPGKVIIQEGDNRCCRSIGGVLLFMAVM